MVNEAEREKRMESSIVCPYKDKCTDHMKMCGSCAHNENRSYYKPRDCYADPWWQHPHSYPWDWHRDPVTITYTDADGSSVAPATSDTYFTPENVTY